MEITLYTTGCPKCIVLEKKLDAKNIQYNKITDINEIRKTGYLTVPVLKVDEKYYTFTEAVEWVNGRN